MSVTIGVRTLVSFATGAAVAVIALVVFQAVTADAAPGDEDATFVPITACRLVDTRPAPDRVGTFGAFGADETKTIGAHGSNGRCSLPSEAVGLVLNVTAVNASTPTFLTIWGDGARPTASALNPAPGQPPTPNAVTVELAGNGSFKIYNLDGTVQVIVDVTGYYTNTSLTDLHERLQALESAAFDGDLVERLEAVEAKTESMTVLTDPQTGQPTVRFSNVNVQVVSGSGNTDAAVNGRGNLIVGYNENQGNTRTGSHNLITGNRHSYGSYGAFVAGRENAVTAPFASVSGGDGNTAKADSSSVSGGRGNTASGASSSVSGGAVNTASAGQSSVSGGVFNTASALFSSVSGGDGNTAADSRSSVSGGFNNTATGRNSSVSGGWSNTASGVYSSVSGGYENTAGPDSGNAGCSAEATASSVSGGRNNQSCDEYASTLGGRDNINEGGYDTIIGGDNIQCAVADEGACGEYSTQAAEWDTAD